MLIFVSFSAGAQEYYQSNKIGMEIKKISQYRIYDTDYYVEKYIEDFKEIKKLYNRKTLIREWELIYSENRMLQKETVLEGDAETVKIYDGNNVITEEYYENSSLVYLKKYKYADKNILSRIEEYDSDSTLKNITDFERDYKGNIKSLTKYEYEGDKNLETGISRYRFTGPDILEEWHGSDEGTGIFIFYSNDGKIKKIINKKENTPVSEKEYFYENRILLKTEEIDLNSGEKIVNRYSEEGKIYEEEYFVNDISDRKIFNYYESDSEELTKKIINKGKNTERYHYYYDSEDNELYKEEYYLNGQLIKETIYIDNDNYYEDYYLKGIRYMRINYKNNERYSTDRW